MPVWLKTDAPSMLSSTQLLRTNDPARFVHAVTRCVERENGLKDFVNTPGGTSTCARSPRRDRRCSARSFLSPSRSRHSAARTGGLTLAGANVPAILSPNAAPVRDVCDSVPLAGTDVPLHHVWLTRHTALCCIGQHGKVAQAFRPGHGRASPFISSPDCT